MLHRCHLRARQKGCDGIGLTRHGKGSKIQLAVDATGLPIAASIAAANVGECQMVAPTLDSSPRAEGATTALVADRAYDSDPLAEALDERGILLLAPHRRNRKKPPRRMPGLEELYPQRYIVERSFSWLQRFRRMLCRYEVKLTNFTGLMWFACSLIVLRRITG